jgi:hypothetical protein
VGRISASQNRRHVDFHKLSGIAELGDSQQCACGAQRGSDGRVPQNRPDQCEIITVGRDDIDDRANHVVRSRANTGQGSDDVADHLLDLRAQVVGADKLSPFVKWTLTSEKHHLGGISNGHMVIPRRLMETGGIDTLDQGVILSEVQGTERRTVSLSTREYHTLLQVSEPAKEQ